MRQAGSHAVTLAILLIAGPSAALAGNNASGRAWLAWSRTSVQDACSGNAVRACDLVSIRQHQKFPLYIQIDNAPDIQKLQVTIRWHPFDRSGRCYSFLSAGPDTVCGWAGAIPHEADIDGEFTSAWNDITFPPGSDRSCVVYWLVGACSNSTPADFCLASVKAMDSAGDMDDLALAGNATILGGTAEGCPAAGGAGNNAGGRVRLSWDPEGSIPTASVPETSPFPLFLHLDAVPDIQQLAITLNWMPYDTAGCYNVLPASEYPFCGWTTAVPPQGGFDGDSAYTWSIVFPPTSSNPSCVVYWFSMSSCDTAPPGKFSVADARARDSNGVVDVLRSVGDAKLLGGPIPHAPAGPEQLSPSETLAPGGPWLVALPNPTTSDLLLQFKLPRNTPHNLALYDISGRLILNIPTSPSAGDIGSFRWDLTNMDGQRVRAGLYFARFVTATGSKVAPIVVLR